jgi:hypothetical protein
MHRQSLARRDEASRAPERCPFRRLASPLCRPGGSPHGSLWLRTGRRSALAFWSATGAPDPGLLLAAAFLGIDAIIKPSLSRGAPQRSDGLRSVRATRSETRPLRGAPRFCDRMSSDLKLERRRARRRFALLLAPPIHPGLQWSMNLPPAAGAPLRSVRPPTRVADWSLARP